MNKTVLTLGRLTCPSCMKKIEEAVKEIKGVQRIKILFDASKAQVIYDDAVPVEDIIKMINELGYQVLSVK